MQVQVLLSAPNEKGEVKPLPFRLVTGQKTGLERVGSRIVACGKTQGKNNATKQPMKRLFATPSAIASNVKSEWVR